MSGKTNHTSLLVEIARLYYEHNFSQQKIANKLDISRPGVSRLLQQARNRGIVRIEIFDPTENGTLLEEKMQKKFGLKKVIVVPNDNEETQIIKKRLGRVAAVSYTHLTLPTN